MTAAICLMTRPPRNCCAMQGSTFARPMERAVPQRAPAEGLNSNVVSLGLASGFIEPLESTSIHLTISAVVRLIQLFPFDGISASLVQLYNDVSRQEMEHVRDFIILHYHATQRTEPMWKACREMSVPGSLQQRLQAWRERAHARQDPGELFRIESRPACCSGRAFRQPAASGWRGR